FHRETVLGEEMSAKYVTPLVVNAFIYNRLFAWKASFAVVPKALDGCCVSNEFPQFIVEASKVLPVYLYLFFTLDSTLRSVNSASAGSSAVSRNRFKEEEFLNFEMPLPPIHEQRKIVQRWQESQEAIIAAQQKAERIAKEIKTEMEDSTALGLVKGQQRQLDPAHAERIKRYLESGEQRFIPEVILSVRKNVLPDVDIKTSKQRGVESVNQDDGIEIGRPWRSTNIRVHRVKIDRRMIAEIRDKKQIRRVDGNHRLALADQLTDDPHLATKYLAPFCMVLLGPPGEAADDYSESLIFHTINSTALPLASEHALKLILGQNSDFDMKPEKEFAFSPDLHFTRLLRDGLLKLSEPAQSRLGNRPLTCLRAAVRGLLEMDATVAKDLPTLRKYSKELLAALNDIVTRLEPSQPALCQAEFFIELAARVWKATPDGKHIERVNATVARLGQLAEWLGKDGLTQLKEGQSLCKQVLDIFNTVRTRIPRSEEHT